MRVLVTGANGFIGGALLSRLRLAVSIGQRTILAKVDILIHRQGDMGCVLTGITGGVSLTPSGWEAWYNPHRLHSALGYGSPMNYERIMQQAA